MKRDVIVAALAAFAAVTPLAAQQVQTRLVDDPTAHTFEITTGPMSLPAGGMEMHGAVGMVLTPVATVRIPVDAYLYAADYRLTDGEGNELPHQLLHHLNVTDPDHRDLFLNIARRLVAMSKETPPIEASPSLMGYRVDQGQRLDVSAMLHNPTATSYPEVWLRITFKYVLPSERRPHFRIYPFALDVAFPAGSKAFDLPPGRHSWSNEARPAVGGLVLGVGSHYHDWVEFIALEDVTADSVLWVGCPVEDADGVVERSTISKYSITDAFHFHPTDLYRVTVVYDNRSGKTLGDGGMGAIGGAMILDPGATWPAVDTTDALYRIDWRHYHHEIQGRWADIAGPLAGRPGLHTIQFDAPPSRALAALGVHPCDGKGHRVSH